MNPARDNGFAARSHAFARIHAGRPARRWVSNVHARVDTLETAVGALPVSVHDGRAGDAWVCSPRTTYGDYAAEEAGRLLPRPWAALAGAAGTAAGRLCDASGVDRAVAINNWLLSTNLYPALDGLNLAMLLRDAVARWPGHTLWFRSLNAVHDRAWLDALGRAGCRLLASRQVYLYEDLAALRRRHANLKRDVALLRRTPLRHCTDADIGEGDYARIMELYAMLYLGKYSRYNPAYGEDFLRDWHRAGLLEFEGFRGEDGRLTCVAGIFRQGRTATAPIVGYDTAAPRTDGLYRLATAAVCRRCEAAGWRLNFSAGAAEFKRVRGGVPTIEYSAVYARHLPRRTRTAVAALSLATRRIGAPLLRAAGL